MGGITAAARTGGPQQNGSLAVAAGVLLAGALAYVLRPGCELTTDLFGLTDALRRVRSGLAPAAAHVPPAILGVLPDAAWAFGLGGILGALWASGPGRLRAAWWTGGGTFVAAWELGQAARLWPGTFDWFDLLASIVAYLAALFVAIPKPRRSIS